MPAWAQCPDWRARGAGLRINGPVYDSTVWDPDGAGPQAPLLVVAGNFTRAGGPDGVIAKNIAAWDGTQWRALGGGLAGLNGFDYYSVNAVKVYNGQLIAGGHFETVGGAPANGIARWDGTSWVPMGAGIAGGEYPTVRAITVLDGHLIVGGTFTMAGGQAASSIARWDGSNWFPLGAGVHGAVQGYPASVFALQDFGEALFVGGVFTGAGGQAASCIARWNGSSWSPLGTGIDYVGSFPYVSALGISGGTIVAGGEFNLAGSQLALNIARWNGNTWSAMGALTGGSNPYVGDLGTYNGELIATGAFGSGPSGTNVARWTGTSWQPLGSGVGRGGNTLAVFNNQLVAGGWFNRAGDQVVESLARWNGSTWLDMPGLMHSSGLFGVRTITPWAGSVVLGGSYQTSETGLSVPTEDLHAWDGRTLRHLGDANHIVHASAVEPAPNGTTNLVVGGQFDSIAGVPVGYIARLNDAPGSTWQPMGAGLDNAVVGITRFNGSTYACGYFTASGPTPLSYIARFDGSAWQPLGTGPSSGPNTATTCMKGYQSGPSTQTLVIGGFFTSAGGVLANRIATFNINTATQTTFWDRLGLGFNETVRAIEYYNGSIYAAGDFTASGSTPLGYIARWNGTAWEQVGGGLNGVVRALTISNGTLIVGGYFTAAGGQTVNRLARWDGHQWSTVGGGISDHGVYALSTFQNEIQVGGEFAFARFGVLETPLWARFSEDGIPWFAEHPESVQVGCRGTASFRVEPAVGYGGLDYRWRKNGVPVAVGPTGTGSKVVSNGISLHIVNANATDAGVYECILSNGCGQTVSRPATLSVTGACPPCPPDFNSDGVLNSQDVFDYLTAFFSVDSIADFNRDAVINSQDFFDYLAAFFAGCA